VLDGFQAIRWSVGGRRKGVSVGLRCWHSTDDQRGCEKPGVGIPQRFDPNYVVPPQRVACVKSFVYRFTRDMIGAEKKGIVTDTKRAREWFRRLLARPLG
jgi:hypothetical protein